MPKSSPPKRLYKYRAFNVNSLRLLTGAEVYYANPAKFNDPLDSSPTIQIDTDRLPLQKLCYRMLLNAHGKEYALREMQNHQYMSTEYGDYKVSPEADAYYMRRLASDVKNLLYEDVGKRGVLSLAARWDCPLMWSHYADEHRGLCIEYDTSGGACPEIQPVNYRKPRSIKVSDLVDWKINKLAAAERSILDTFFFSKASQWRYEKEWRDIRLSAGSSPAPYRISAIYFGLRCDVSVITTIVKLHVSAEPAINFYDIYPLDDSFRLKRRLVDTDEIEATGLRSSTLLDFKDVFLDETDA